jgi:hypothetical protein
MSVDLFTANFSTIGGANLYDAIVDFTRVNHPPDDRAQEGYRVDFKEKWNEKSLRVIAGFANTFGGIIIVGVSEDKGKAKEIIGEESKSDLKTRFAGSIAANITPTPSYDIAECELPSSAERRLCVIRVRPANRIHFLTTKGDSPVYVRNEDQAIPAPAAELRSLIVRERESLSSIRANQQSTAVVFGLLPIFKPRPNNPALSASEEFRPADSVLRVSIVPEQRENISLDYNIEETFRGAVSKVFPKDSLAEDQMWSTDGAHERKKSYFRIDGVHVDRGIESKWLLTNERDFGFATLFSIPVQPEPLRLWSLPDLAAELIASIRAAHFMFTHTGYLGEARIDVSMSPATSQLLAERGMLPFLRHADLRCNPWPIVIPQLSQQRQAREPVGASVDSNFHTRTEGISPLVADLLNQLLRDLSYGADLNQLRQYVQILASKMQTA